ncbi:MAG: hypothetical protein M3389_05095 [Actinomycetota bacterium]|nr:hypothetical protein [Actinomycetota bacterium]
MSRALLAALLAALAVAAPAAAQNGTVRGVGTGYPIAGPVFGGGEMVWVEREGLDVRLVGGDVGRPAQVLATVSSPLSWDGVHPAFGASDTTVLLWAMFTVRAKGSEEPVGVEASAGPRGALRRLSGDAAVAYRFPRLVGDRVAYIVGLPGDAWVARFLDPVTGARTDVPTASVIYPWSAAGDVLAHLAPTEAREPVVTNWRTGEELYRPGLPEGWQPSAVDVMPDGTAVWSASVVEGGVRRYVHGVSTPAQPAVRPIPLLDGSLVHELAAGRVLYRSQSEWAVADLEGRVLARVPAQVTSIPPGTDGRRIGYVTRPCAVAVVHVYEIDNPPEPKGVAPAPCPAARVAGRPSVGRDGLRIPVRCDTGASMGCLSDVYVAVKRRGRRRPQRYVLVQHALEAGETDVLTVGRRRSLRGRLRVRIVVQEPEGDGQAVSRFRLRG